MGYRELFTGITLGLIGILMLWYYEMQLHFGFKIAIGATIILYLVIPILFHFNASVQRHLVFLPFVRWPKDVNFDLPKTQGLSGGRNLYLNIDSQPENKIGVWHLLPKSIADVSTDKSPEADPEFWNEAMRKSGKPIFIYLHGNSGSRAGEHRKELYVILQNLEFHVVCFDYRGYADSTLLPPSETSTVSDGATVYNWVLKVLGKNSTIPIFIWGHSLGTGVATHLVSNICKEGNDPKALILESPFTSLGEEVKNHMLSAIYRYMPFFDSIFIEPLHQNDIEFSSSKHIQNIPIPILILHAEDDPVVPYFLGIKLAEIGANSRSNDAKPIYFKGFSASYGYAHKFICRSPDLSTILTEYVQCSIKDDWPCKALHNNSAF